MVFNLLVLPLLGGFFFASHCNITRASIKHIDGYRLFFQSALWGLLFLLIGHTICYYGCINYSDAVARFHDFLSQAHMGKSIIALVIGIVLPFIVNVFYGKEKWTKKEISRYGDHFDELLLRAFEEEKLVQISMQNGKVYVGRTLQAFEPLSGFEYVKILPVQSGYRHPIQHKVTFTANYTKAYWKHIEDNPSNAQINNYKGVVLLVSQIVSASFFDQELYNTFNKLPAMHSDTNDEK